jgi:hypothetical protein
MEEIVIHRIDQDVEGFAFRVSVIDNTDRTVHNVSLGHDDYERFGLLLESPERFVERCFEFLLTHRPKESIPSQFEIRTIAEYFPDLLEEFRLRMMTSLRPIPVVGEEYIPSTTDRRDQEE